MRAVILFAFAALLIIVPAAAAHPLHTSLTQVTYDAGTREVKMAIRVFADDFGEAVLGEGRALPREGEGFPSGAVMQYLAAKLSLTTGEGQELPVRWIGTRRKGAVIWLFIRAPAPEGLEGLRIRNRILFEHFDDQVNLVQVFRGGHRATLLFTQNDVWKPLPRPGE